DVEVAERYGGNAVRLPHGEEQLFVVALGDRVHRCGVQRFGLRSGHRGQLLTRHVVAHLPFAAFQTIPAAQPGRAQFPVHGAVRAFTVYGHGRRHHDLANPAPALHDLLQQDPGAAGVDLTVAGDVVHRLPHADERRIMQYDVDPVERPGDRAGVGHRPAHEFGPRVQIGRDLNVRPVYLGLEA